VVACTRALATSRSQVAHPRVGGIAIDLESFGAEAGCQWHVEARPQVADEAFDLALGPGSIGLAEPRHEAVMMREVEKGAVITMQPRVRSDPESVTTVRMLS